MDDPFTTADEAASECIAYWQEVGDQEKLADAWASSAAVDFYTGQRFASSMEKFQKTVAICTQAKGREHPTCALALFNMAYINHLVFRNIDEAINLFAESLEIRRCVVQIRMKLLTFLHAGPGTCINPVCQLQCTSLLSSTRI